MSKILVSGLVNLETSAKVDGFPLEYTPIRYPFYGVTSCVSGVGYNVARALQTLGSEPYLLSILGDDDAGRFIRGKLESDGLLGKGCIIRPQEQTAESVVLVGPTGKREIFCDLKGLQDMEPLRLGDVGSDGISIALLTNINFNRRLLREYKNKGILIGTDVHVLSDVYDAYNKDFLECADILFLSNENILGREGDFIKELYNVYHNRIIVCGCGQEGALIYIGSEDRFVYQPAVAPRGIVSTVGAGDALFSAFMHFYVKGVSVEECLKRAVYFAGLKIASSGGSNGFVSEDELLKIMA